MTELTVPAYIADLPEDQKKAMTKLRSIIRKNLPKGFKETINDKIPAYGVPHSKYQDG